MNRSFERSESIGTGRILENFNYDIERRWIRELGRFQKDSKKPFPNNMIELNYIRLNGKEQS